MTKEDEASTWHMDSEFEAELTVNHTMCDLIACQAPSCFRGKLAANTARLARAEELIARYIQRAETVRDNPAVTDENAIGAIQVLGALRAVQEVLVSPAPTTYGGK